MLSREREAERTIGKSDLASALRRAGRTAARAWPKLRPLLVLAFALAMVEFVALDASLLIAADVMLYLELLLGAWTLALLARFPPGLPTALMLLPYRLFEPGAPIRPAKREDDRQ